MRKLFLTLLFAATSLCAQAQTEKVVEIPSRDVKVRALLIQPANPVGSVVLLAGGHGVLALSADGKIGWGGGNQLVRTRMAYARAGFATIVPDAAPDLGTPKSPKTGFRWSAEHGRDIGAVVAYMRKITEPVAIVGTSRAAVATGAVLAHTTGSARPDMVVQTAPMLMPHGSQPSFHLAMGGNPKRAQLPFFVVGHKKDTCAYTLVSSFELFRKWHGGKVEILVLDGPPGSGDPCDAQAAHGFAGIDGEVVAAVTDWITRQAAKK
jgi:hypothetical protein